MAIPVSRDAGRGLLVLAGRRDPRAGFLGGFHAFPGGVHEESDGELIPGAEEEVLRRTAARELLEETGLRIDPADLLDAGRRITPPFSSRRFDSRMYLAPFAEPLLPSPSTAELSDLHWTRPADLLTRWERREIRVSPPLLPLLREMVRDSSGSPRDLAGRLRSVNEEIEQVGASAEFAPHVHLIPQATPTLPPATHTNCYLVGSREFVVIDPGSARADEAERLRAHIARRVKEGGRPVAILGTHHHPDHVAGVEVVANEWELPVRMHRLTWEAWGGIPPQGLDRQDLEDGAEIHLSGGERLRALHTPGHAVGHLSFLEERAGALFAGDLVSGASTILVESAPGGLVRYLASLARIRDLNATTLFPAHGTPMTAPAADIQRVMDHRLDRERRILAAVVSGARTVDEVVGVAYDDLPDSAHPLAALQAGTHLMKLEDEGRISRDPSGTWSPA
ncbi:MAG: MBL fold metallo-hydrolase [Gemmatimonadota bacterium]|nr:MBL fold metallo-hydrolase [Gemmatimonadota bacterium]MDP6802546.1 MBL fold metallo-hydrolase [Gemmatimonadota bacterium]MDP7031809.1 MBL fold metallo-hydrolase [Gemmatimonadota bacterium]